MNLDPDHQPNGREWTFHSLREYLLRVVSDLSAKQSQLADAQDKAVQAALVAQEKAVQAALAAADKAVLKAEEGAMRWQQSANEWRGAMNDRERTFIPRTEFNQAVETLGDKIEKLEKLVLATMNNRQGSDQTWAYVIAGLGILIGAAGLISRLSQ